jgi:hypothetical protein
MTRELPAPEGMFGNRANSWSSSAARRALPAAQGQSVVGANVYRISIFPDIGLDGEQSVVLASNVKCLFSTSRSKAGAFFMAGPWSVLAFIQPPSIIVDIVTRLVWSYLGEPNVYILSSAELT